VRSNEDGKWSGPVKKRSCSKGRGPLTNCLEPIIVSKDWGTGEQKRRKKGVIIRTEFHEERNDNMLEVFPSFSGKSIGNVELVGTRGSKRQINEGRRGRFSSNLYSGGEEIKRVRQDYEEERGRSRVAERRGGEENARNGRGGATGICGGSVKRERKEKGENLGESWGARLESQQKKHGDA